ncbi:mitochondrial thiamine pyrophosphate carrier-like [Saccostrea echinata]|uniref:mitochondrial thiamine pyrophosphate carrier-like n=1 Tax=Saccostrea echinata TaxID=191078 RepID=UPI002A82DC3E|nr:mitochondrial thiamine pyrophosphate carrier-like [Saccostrea echinata]XP_061175813.1 mitochondrial thiamine pyrophosphate carrier-like [Saccostrea echinata]
MVGYTPEKETQLSAPEQALAGAVTGAVSRALFQPLDVLKIRFQLQIEPLKKCETSKYWSISQATRTIITEEGVTALWKGHVPAQLLSVLYGIVQFVSFEAATKVAWRVLPEGVYTDHKPLTHMLCGSIAGCVSTVVVQPVDVMRTRLIAQGKQKMYTSMINGIMATTQSEGIMGLYRGLLPAMSQIAPQIGLQFGFYTLLRDLWKKFLHKDGEKILETQGSLICGSGAGIISKILIYPLDVVKKRLQIQGFEEARSEFGSIRHYRGMKHCLYMVAKEEGIIKGFYKGLTPSLWKAALVSGSSFYVYEKVCQLLEFRKKKKST